MWLAKWLLVIPHYVVLFFLWVAFVVLTMIAFFAILLTGRYPRVLFDFNVGVLRWTWRVNYYGYDGLGTDRYPPFTLADVPDYPAHFGVDYPEHLSRGLVLVKWWLLALPHLLIVAVLVGGGTWVAWQTSDSRWSWGGPSGGLIGLLVLIAAITLAVTGGYPQSLFDLILGLDRWVLRVAAYVTLMTDQYPPFRLDLGGADPARGLDGLAVPSPGTAVGTSAAGPGPNDSSPGRATPGGVSVATGATPAGPVGVAPPAYPSGGGTAGRVVALVVGVLLTLLGLMLVLAGAAAGWLNSQRDADGFLTSGTASIGTPTAALATKGIDVRVEGSDWL